jgi:hypothetical protein
LFPKRVRTLFFPEKRCEGIESADENTRNKVDTVRFKSNQTAKGVRVVGARKSLEPNHKREAGAPDSPVNYS